MAHLPFARLGTLQGESQNGVFAEGQWHHNVGQDYIRETMPSISLESLPDLYFDIMASQL